MADSPEYVLVQSAAELLLLFFFFSVYDNDR